MAKRRRRLHPGTYLVGRHDGLVDEFFVAVQSDGPACNVASCHDSKRDFTEQALCNWDAWWWHPMEVPEELPPDEVLDQIPPHHFELP